jgi:hypothetical protein
MKLRLPTAGDTAKRMRLPLIGPVTPNNVLSLTYAALGDRNVSVPSDVPFDCDTLPNAKS